MNRIRVLMLVPDMPDPVEKIQGGIQSAVLNLLRGFASQPVEILLVSICSTTDTSYKIEILPNVTIQYLPEGPSNFSFVNYLVFCPAKIRKVIKEFRPDVIHFEEGMNFLLLRLFIAKYSKHVLTIHGITFAEARLKKSFLQRIKWYQNGVVEWLLLPRNIIHISKYSRQFFLSSGKPSSPVIFNAVSTKFFNVESKQSTNNQLLFVGVINNRKNILALLKAVLTLKQEGKIFHLNVVGDFDPSEQYRETILSFVEENDLSRNINFLGWRSQSELEMIYRDTDIVILPSLQETLPVVIAETMAAGRVMVTSIVGGTSEMIAHNETGYTYCNREEGALEKILASLYNNAEAIQRVGENARRAAKEKFHGDVIALQTFKYYKQISLMPTLVLPIFNI